MKRSTHTHRKLVKRIALGLAVAAIAVPAARRPRRTRPAPRRKAASRPRSRPTALAPAASPRRSSASRPTDRARALRPTQLRDAYADNYTTDAPRSGPATVDLPQAEPLTGPSGFDWLDAGVGIAIGIAVSLVLVAVALLVSRRRERIPAF